MSLQKELANIETRIGEINKQIRMLENEKCVLVKRQEECSNLLRLSMPSSSGGKKKDDLNEWKRNV